MGAVTELDDSIGTDPDLYFILRSSRRTLDRIILMAKCGSIVVPGMVGAIGVPVRPTTEGMLSTLGMSLETHWWTSLEGQQPALAVIVMDDI